MLFSETPTRVNIPQLSYYEWTQIVWFAMAHNLTLNSPHKAVAHDTHMMVTLTEQGMSFISARGLKSISYSAYIHPIPELKDKEPIRVCLPFIGEISEKFYYNPRKLREKIDFPINNTLECRLTEETLEWPQLYAAIPAIAPERLKFGDLQEHFGLSHPETFVPRMHPKYALPSDRQMDILYTYRELGLNHLQYQFSAEPKPLIVITPVIPKGSYGFHRWQGLYVAIRPTEISAI